MPKKIDLIGKRYGKLVVIEQAFGHCKKGIYWVCKCDCGNEKIIYGASLRRELTSSCGCAFSNRGNNLTGKICDRLTVIKLDDTVKSGIYWICKCKCGNEVSVLVTSLLSESTRSCGCLQKEIAAKQIISQNTKYTKEISAAKVIYRTYSDGNITFEDFYRLSQLPCNYCGREPFKKYTKFDINKMLLEEIETCYFIYNGLDRVENAIRVHNLDNVVPCCYRCNFAKNDKTVDEFKSLIDKLYLNFKDQEYIT